MMALTVRQMMATLKSPEGVESLKKQAGGLLPAGLPQSLEKGIPASKEEQEQMRQEMEQGLEMLKQMLPQKPTLKCIMSKMFLSSVLKPSSKLSLPSGMRPLIL